jgi:hypothetical protein
MTPHRISLLLFVFTVNPRSWCFLSQQIPDLLNREVGAGIRDANSVVVEFAHKYFRFKRGHCRSPYRSQNVIRIAGRALAIFRKCVSAEVIASVHT